MEIVLAVKVSDTVILDVLVLPQHDTDCWKVSPSIKYSHAVKALLHKGGPG